MKKISKKEAIKLVGEDEVKRMLHYIDSLPTCLVSPEGCKIYPKKSGCVIVWFIYGYSENEKDVNEALARIRKEN